MKTPRNQAHSSAFSISPTQEYVEDSNNVLEIRVSQGLEELVEDHQNILSKGKVKASCHSNSTMPFYPDMSSEPQISKHSTNEKLKSGQQQWKPARWDPRFLGFKPRMIDFSLDTDISGPVHITPKMRESSSNDPWLFFLNTSPTRANSIASSLSSTESDSSGEMAFNSYHRTPTSTGIGLRALKTSKKPNANWPSVDRDTPDTNDTADLDSESTTRSNFFSIGTPRRLFRSLQTKNTIITKSLTWIEKLTTHFRVNKVRDWIKNNLQVSSFILFSWFIIFILAQTSVLQVNTWEFLNPHLKWRNNRYYSGLGQFMRIDHEWRPEAKDIVRLMFSKNSSQTIMDAKILYHLQSIEERQSRSGIQMQKQFDDAGGILDALIGEIRHFRGEVSRLRGFDKNRMERQVDRLKDELRYCNDKRSAESRRNLVKVITKTHRPTFTIITRTKTFYKPTFTTPKFAVPTKGPFLTNKDLDKIIERVVRTHGLLEKGVQGQLNSIFRLLCPDETGILSGLEASRFKKCLKSRRPLFPMIRSRGILLNQIILTPGPYAGNSPYISILLIVGFMLFYDSRGIAKRIAEHQNRTTFSLLIRISTVATTFLGAIIYSLNIVPQRISGQKSVHAPITWMARVWLEITSTFVALIQIVYSSFPDPVQEWCRSLRWVKALTKDQRNEDYYSAKLRPILEGLRGCQKFASGYVAGQPFMFIKLLVLLSFFGLVTKAMPAIRVWLREMKPEGGDVQVQTGGQQQFLERLTNCTLPLVSHISAIKEKITKVGVLVRQEAKVYWGRVLEAFNLVQPPDSTDPGSRASEKPAVKPSFDAQPPFGGLVTRD
ncbi:hypothetical protein H072_2010 [Dactylellina haptotyla CBS 200.50]|uniref:Uncharacterized protein n=1 Tax=Dactylellina haptotyla (strain CBS 200.50) TaxID=1284197 RepID=S8AM79_DACHA|nr:hypothetical protein H072_2010 [Dactylellina haptotyla CBS 200.50]